MHKEYIDRWNTKLVNQPIFYGDCQRMNGNKCLKCDGLGYILCFVNDRMPCPACNKRHGVWVKKDIG